MLHYLLIRRKSLRVTRDSAVRAFITAGRVYRSPNHAGGKIARKGTGEMKRLSFVVRLESRMRAHSESGEICWFFVTMKRWQW